MALIQPILGKIESHDFSYPLNSEYPNSISFSGVHAGLLIAYGSSNLVIVLIEGKYVAAVLKGHKTTVCTVSFETRAPHLLSCDITGNCYFWQYQDNFWQNTRIEVFPTPLTSVTWYSARREISYSSKDGLFYNTITNFGNNPMKLCNKSCFCTFNYDGSLLASHNNKLAVSIFMFQSNPYLTQVVKHPSPIISFDFHPFLPSFLTITKDYVLRIWRQSVLSTFACTAAIKVPFIGFFVRQPSFFNNPNSFTPAKSAKILFIDQNNKRYKLRIDENGLIKNLDEGSPFKRVQVHPDFGLRAVYKTNLGTEMVLVKKNKLTVATRERQRDLLFHHDIIEHSQFASNSYWLFTLDKSHVLIIWPIFNPYFSSKEISNNAELAIWQNSTTLLFIENSQLKSFNTKTSEISLTDFPSLNNCKYLYSNGNDIYVITDNQIISQNHQIDIQPYKFAAFSKPYKNMFLVLLADDKNQLKLLQLPSNQEISLSTRVNSPIKGIGIISFISFVVLTDNELEFWSNSNDGFECQNKVYLPGMNGLYCDSSKISGRIFCYDNSRLFSVLNGVTPYLSTPNITGVTVNDVGHIVVFYGYYFKVYPSWCYQQTPKSIYISNPNLSSRNQLLNVGTLPPDAQFLQKVTAPTKINYMISPHSYIHPPQTSLSIIQSTLFHLLECSIITKLNKCNPEQIPAIPNQYAIPSAFDFPADFDNKEYHKLIQTIRNIKEDIDMFGLRYLLAIKETAWPPSYFAFWLSYSKSQSQIAEHLYSYIDANMLSKFYIPISIHQHSILVKIVQKALQNMWSSVQKVENVALLYAALGQNLSISKLYTAVGDDNRADFFKHDFKVERWRKCAIKNAYSSLSHHNVEMAAALFLVAGDIRLCINVILNKLEDPILAFLVLRLITHSDYNHPDMKAFLQEWKSDDVISGLISHLLQKPDTINILRNLLLEKEFNKQATVFGDRRIALFELYSYLAKNTDIASQIIINLNQDGLAPLSQYLTGIINCPYETFRHIGLQNQSNDEQEEIEPEIESFEPTIEKVKEFDFGQNLINDDWSDEYDEEISDKETEEVEIEVKNGIPTKELNSFDSFLSDEIDSLCSFFFNKEKEENQNEDAGLFAMKNGSITTASILLGDEKRNLLLKFISQFLDNCCILYYKSALIPITSKKMLALSLKLFNIIIRYNQNELKENCTSLDLKKFMAYQHNEYIYSAFNSAIVVSLWTYFTQFLTQLLDETIDPVSIDKDNIPQETSYFDADLTSPKYPDWLPMLLSRYSVVKPGEPASLERARLLIMFLIFQKVYQITKQLSNGDNKFLEKMTRRQKSMHKTLQFYEIALGSPPFTKPPNDLVNDNTDATSRITSIIDKELNETFDQLHGLQKNSMMIQFFPPIYRNGEIMTKDRIEIKSKTTDFQFSSIKSMALMPLKKGHLVAIADNNLIKIDITNQTEPVFMDFHPQFTPETSNGSLTNTASSISQSNTSQHKLHAPPEAFAIIPHPNFDLFICLSPTEAYLYDFEQGKTDFKIYISPSQYKISCAAFSPNGTKLAIGTSVLDIFSFDLSKWETNPSIKWDMKGPITALAWINSDTMIAVAYTNPNNQTSTLVIANTLLKYHQPMEMKKEWGIITCIRSVTRKDKLVFGTKNGFVVVTNMRANYEVECIISLGVPTISLSNLHEIIGVGTGNCHLVLFSTTKPKNSFKFEAPNKINSVIITDRMFLAAGDYSSISIWNALES